jgi:tetratricopeptide (TPR) repeat protein
VRSIVLCLLIAGSMLAAVSLVGEPSATPTQAQSAGNDRARRENAVEAAYQKLIESDDAAQEEVDEWIKTESAFREGGGNVSDATLRARVLQRLEPVRRAYEDFLRDHPTHVRARVAYGSFLNDLNDEAGARTQWEKALALDPHNPAIWNNLANLYGHRGPIEKAFAYYEKAIELNPKESVYYQNLATTVFLFRRDATNYFKCDEERVFTKSLELYRKALQFDPTNFVLASDYAQTYYGIRPAPALGPEARAQAQQRLNDEAILAWTEALKLAGDDVQREGVQVHLARIKINAGRFAEARTHLESITNSIYLELKQRLARNLAAKEEAAAAPSAKDGNQ